jgi:hypothetical protein
VLIGFSSKEDFKAKGVTSTYDESARLYYVGKKFSTDDETLELSMDEVLKIASDLKGKFPDKEMKLIFGSIYS